MIRFIYILTENNIPIYVGKSKNPKQREHFHKRKYPNSILEIIDEIPTNEWKFWERHYIWLYRSWGFNINNKKCHGGNGADILSNEHKRKISEGLKKAYAKKPRSKEFYNKLSTINKKFKHTLESKKKLSEASKGNTSHLGFKHSEESKRKMAEANKGKIVSDETRLKLSITGKGLKRTVETKKRLSEANKGKILSESHKFKLSQSHIGKKHSNEHKKKISEANKIRWKKYNESK